MVGLLVVVVIFLGGLVIYLITTLQEEKREVKKLRSKKKPQKMSEEEKRQRANMNKAFKYAKKNISDVNSLAFKKTFMTMYEDLLQEEETKKKLEKSIKD